MRGRKPKPTHLKLVTGNAGKRPLPKGEPKPRPLAGDLPPVLPMMATSAPAMMPPAWLLDEAKVEWGRIAEELSRLGLLTKIDRGALAAVCQAYGRWQQAEEALAKIAARDPIFKGLMIKTSNKNLIQNPLVGAANTAQRDYVRYCAEFGMTPSARTRIDTSGQGEEDPAESYFA